MSKAGWAADALPSARLWRMANFYYRVEKLSEWATKHTAGLFPQNLRYREEANEARVILEAENIHDEQRALDVVRNECVRFFFLTNCALTPELQTVEVAPNTFRGISSVRIDACLIRSEDAFGRIGAQDWSDRLLPLQLRLWRTATEVDDMLGISSMLLYQIVECETPNPPPYTDSSSPPSALTETKLLRDLFSHHQTAIRSEQLLRYCDHLKITRRFLNPSGEDTPPSVRKRVRHVREFVRQIIAGKITRKAADGELR